MLDMRFEVCFVVSEGVLRDILRDNGENYRIFS